MKYTRRSLIFTTILVGIVIFFLGLHLGKSIERLDKTFVPPTPVTPSPTSAQLSPSLLKTQYQTFDFTLCGVSFLISSDIVQRTSASDEAQFSNSRGDRIFVSCNDSYIADQETLFKTASASSSARLLNQNITTYNLDSDMVWVIRNKKRQQVLFSSSPALAPLLQQTLELK